ncbi:unnamed protein product [Sympodiomycopsis kandeliae]
MEERQQQQHCSFVLLAEFDIDKGSTLSHVYPSKSLVASHDDHALAELMLPDGAHARSEDWTVFFLKQPDDIPVTYVLNLVRTKHDDSVRRGALVKAMAVGSTHPCIHVFKPILLLALDEYFSNPGPSSLARLYDSINAIDLSALPVLSRSEKLVLKASDRKDLFLDKYSLPSADHPRPGSSASHTSSSRPSGSRPISPVATRRRPSEHDHLSAAALPRRDTHFWETSIQYGKMDIPIKWPMDTFQEEVGEYSLSSLFSTFSSHPVTGPLHAHLHSNGSQTPPMTILFNAILTGKRVIFLGHNMPAATVAGHVLSAAALATGCGAVLPNLVRTRCSPYANLISLDALEQTPGFIAGVTNPRFEQLKCWDLLCNIETGRITIAKDIEPAPRLNLHFSGAYSASAASGSASGAGSMSYTTGIGSSNGSMGISNEVATPHHVDEHRTIGRGGAGSVASGSSTTGSSAIGSSTLSSLASVGGDEFGNKIASPPPSNQLPSNGIPDSRQDSFDLVFMEEMLSAIASRYSEQYIRSRIIDYVGAFARHIHRHEDYFFQRSLLTQQPYLNGQLGSGTAFGDRDGELKELISNAGRVEGFKLTSSYSDWTTIESERHSLQRQIFHPDTTSSLDIWHQLSRLRGRGKPLSSAELDLILTSFEKVLKSNDAIIEFLTYLPQYTSGLSILAQCLYHPNSTIRLTTCEILNRIGSYQFSGLKFVQSLPTFHRLTLARITHEFGQDMKGIPQQTSTTVRASTPLKNRNALLSAGTPGAGKLGLPVAMSRQVSSSGTSFVSATTPVEQVAQEVANVGIDGLPASQGEDIGGGGSTFKAMTGE